MSDEKHVKVLRNKEWVNIEDCLYAGDIIRYYDSTGKITMLDGGYGITETMIVPEFFENDKSYNAELIMLSEILSLDDSKKFIKSLIGKYASYIGRYQFKKAYKNLYDYLKSIDIDVRKREKPHIDYLTKEELLECEEFLRYCAYECNIDINDTLEVYGLLANENSFYENTID